MSLPARRRRRKAFRIGGMVKEGSVKRRADGVTVNFIVTDTEKDLLVAYKGILPDLFRKGKGVVAQGKLADGGTRFVASEVLAKHDENYMPPEAAKAVGDAHQRAADNKAKGDRRWRHPPGHACRRREIPSEDRILRTR